MHSRACCGFAIRPNGTVLQVLNVQRPDFVALNIQELGGKNFKTTIPLVHDFIECVNRFCFRELDLILLEYAHYVQPPIHVSSDSCYLIVPQL